MKRILQSIVYAFARRLTNIQRQADSRDIIARFKRCGSHVDVYYPVCIQTAENVTVGDNVSIGPFVHMWAKGGIRIGSRVMIGSHSAITTLTHDHRQASMQSTLIAREIIIEDDVWIGAHSVIMPGITIGSGAVVGAGAVVTKNVEPRSIVAGVPAKVLKYRKTNP